MNERAVEAAGMVDIQSAYQDPGRRRLYEHAKKIASDPMYEIQEIADKLEDGIVYIKISFCRFHIRNWSDSAGGGIYEK